MATRSSSAVDSGHESAYWDEAAETLSRDELRQLQTERFVDLIRRCFATDGIYRRKLQAVGAELEDVTSLDKIAALPHVTKDELREDQRRHPPFGTFILRDAARWRELHPSTGTTGQPVKTIWSDRDITTITDFTARTLWQFGVRPGDIVQNAFAYGLWVAGMSCHYAARKIGCLVVPTGVATPTAKQIEFAREIGSTVLLATPSYAIHIAESLRAEAIDPGDLKFRIGAFGGEPGASTGPTRHRIETGLGVDAYDYYGLAEIGPTFGSECTAKAGTHFAEDHVLVECVDPVSKQPVGEGEAGILVFTTLTREATPMLRYWSNDVASLTYERCSCGRTHARAIGGIVGRHDDLLIFRGAKFYPVQVEKVVRSFPELADEFRIEVVREPDAALLRSCAIVVETAIESADIGERVSHALRTELGVSVDIRLEPLGTLSRTTFKASRVVARDSVYVGRS